EHLLIADQEMPERPQLRQLAAQSRFLRWDAKAKKAVREEPAPPDAPDAARAAVVNAVDMRRFVISPEWAALGAAARPLPEGGVEVSTRLDGGFSASLPIDFSKLDFAQDWHWLHMQCRVSGGAADLSIMSLDPAPGGQTERSITFQKKLRPGPGVQTLSAYLRPAGAAALLFANPGTMIVEGEKPQSSQSQIAILSMAVIKMNKAA
ncbi:MAG TPA: hypothetical protein VHB73_03685, partial [Alphaproteobacteria bacterium]|nr:hypothetical protein [Alphaproteobacteria bacterium]